MLPACASPAATSPSPTDVEAASGGGGVTPTTSTDAATTAATDQAAAGAGAIVDASGGTAPTLPEAIAQLQVAVRNLGVAVAQLQQLYGGQVGATIGGGGLVAQEPVQTPIQAQPSPDQVSQAYTTSRSDVAQSKASEPKSSSKSKSAPKKAGKALTAEQKAFVKKWVSGDTNDKQLNQDLLYRIAQVGERVGKKVQVVAGYRSVAEQRVLYARYKAGTGNLAARPGKSNHQEGNAIDAKIGGVSLAKNAKAKQAAFDLGLHFPVKGEPWHTEIKK